MPIDQRKRQKKLAKQRAKRKAKTASHKRTQPGRSSWTSQFAGLEFELAARAPIYKCYVAEEIFDESIGQGMGHVVVSRLSGSQVAAGIFLVDAYCLGVKDAFAMLKPREVFDDFIATSEMRMRVVEPAYAKKLVEDSVAYARDLGFEPHPDYKLPRKILNDIDASECAVEFTFGKDGKPFFVSGPYDSEARIRQVIDTLQRRLGSDGYHYMVGVSPDSEVWVDDDPDDDWDDEDEKDDEGDDK